MKSALPVALLALGLSIWACTFTAKRWLHEREERRARPDFSFVCDSSTALAGGGYYVYPNKDLAPQDCRRHPSFPGAILCERTVTLECKP